MITSTGIDHHLGVMLSDAAHGDYPVADGSVDVLDPLNGPCDAVALFTGHLAVAVDLSEEWIHKHLPEDWGANSANASASIIHLLSAISTELGQPHSWVNELLVAPRTAAHLRGTLTDGGEPTWQWTAYHSEVASYESRAGSATLAIGIGPAGRYDLYAASDEVSAYGKPAHLVRELLTAAKTLVPPGTMLFASAPISDPRVLRGLLSAGFTPVATEALFLTRPTMAIPW
jgi:hypothetical protein